MINVTLLLAEHFKWLITPLRYGLILLCLTLTFAYTALTQATNKNSHLRSSPNKANLAVKSQAASNNNTINNDTRKPTGESSEPVTDGITRNFQQLALNAALAMKNADPHFYERELVFDKRIADAESLVNQLEALNEQSQSSKSIVVRLGIELALLKSMRTSYGVSGVPPAELDTREKSLDKLNDEIKSTKIIEPIPPAISSKKVEITPGMAKEEVVKLLGPPMRSIVFGNKNILEYQNIIVELRANKVVDVKIK